MQAFNGFLTSLQFLTIIPIKIKELDFEGSISWFPIIGCLIGSLLGGTGFLFGCLPKEVNTSLIIIISIVITGALHLDGFCDTLDGLSSTK
ncbi:MAG: adenosylcobinamide-GDP ribazoletransferase, partial [bacterium]